MESLLFGTGGTPHSSTAPSTIYGIERIAELKLGCMELEFVQGVRMGKATALHVAEAAILRGVKLTAHGPYYINLNAREPEKIKASQERILQTARIGSACGASSITFHAAFYMGSAPEQVYDTVKKHLTEILEQLRDEGIRIWIRPEIMGKTSQFGTLDEILTLSKELDGVAPVIDFAHLHARMGRMNSYPEFISVFRRVEEKLGRNGLDNMHIHFSGIKYGARGELKHLNLKESDLQYGALLQALRDYEAGGLVICESPNLEEDARLLQETYNALVKTGGVE